MPESADGFSGRVERATARIVADYHLFRDPAYVEEYGGPAELRRVEVEQIVEAVLRAAEGPDWRTFARAMERGYEIGVMCHGDTDAIQEQIAREAPEFVAEGSDGGLVEALEALLGAFDEITSLPGHWHERGYSPAWDEFGDRMNAAADRARSVLAARGEEKR
jgi:hypothetical protein